MNDGYYWYRESYTPVPSAWKICQVSGGYVHFFGQVSQEIGNKYLTTCVEFGPMIHIFTDGQRTYEAK